MMAIATTTTATAAAGAGRRRAGRGGAREVSRCATARRGAVAGGGKRVEGPSPAMSTVATRAVDAPASRGLDLASMLAARQAEAGAGGGKRVEGPSPAMSTVATRAVDAPASRGLDLASMLAARQAEAGASGLNRPINVDDLIEERLNELESVGEVELISDERVNVRTCNESEDTCSVLTVVMENRPGLRKTMEWCLSYLMLVVEEGSSYRVEGTQVHATFHLTDCFQRKKLLSKSYAFMGLQERFQGFMEGCLQDGLAENFEQDRAAQEGWM